MLFCLISIWKWYICQIQINPLSKFSWCQVWAASGAFVKPLTLLTISPLVSWPTSSCPAADLNDWTWLRIEWGAIEWVHIWMPIRQESSHWSSWLKAVSSLWRDGAAGKTANYGRKSSGAERPKLRRWAGGVNKAGSGTDAESKEMLILAKIQRRTKNKQRKCPCCSVSQI